MSVSKYSFDQFSAIRTFRGLAYGPSGDCIYYTANTSGQHNLWSLPSGGGFARQLTSFDTERITNFSVAPNGQHIIFLADTHGDEMRQVWCLPAAGGWPEQLTHISEAQFSVGEWLPDSRRVLITANDIEPSEQHPQLLDIITGDRKRFATGGLHYAATASPTGAHVLVMELMGNTNQNLYLYNLGTEELVLVTPHEGEAIFLPGPWARDGSGFYFLTNQDREFTGLALYKIPDKSWSYIFTPEYDVEKVVLSGDRNTLVAVLNEDGASQLYARDLRSDREIDLPRLPFGVINDLDVHPFGNKIAMLFDTAREATNLFELDVEAGKFVALEQSMLGGLNKEDLVKPKKITYPSFDRDIPAWIYRPEKEGRVPVLVSIHGGPEAQERPGYAYLGLYQYLLSNGIGVFAPNIRGSKGYGISYQKLIHRDWGGAELKDVQFAAEYLRSLDWVDSTRLAIFGGSFGGFVTLSALTRLPEYWVAGVDLVGPSNLVTFVKSVPQFWRSMMRDWIGDAEEDRDFLLERSPITYIEQIRAPLLIIQGANDPRVVQAESDQIVAHLRDRGVEVEYFVDKKGGHGPANRKDSKQWFYKIARYLEARLNVDEG